jgi:predicted NBD/HSP70 family sugar kinase
MPIGEGSAGLSIQGHGSLSSLRELNRLRVVESVRASGTITRADISRETGLARSTVSSLVGELHAQGVIVEHEDAAPSSGGRPPVLLSLNPRAGLVLGVHFDHPRVRVAVADLAHTILAEAERALDVDNNATAGLDAAATLTEQVLTEIGASMTDVLGIGAAVSGPIDQITGRVGSSAILPGWFGVDVEVELERRLAVTVHVDNDANLGALAESVLGAGRGASEMIYVMMASGVGSGLILDGRPYRGARGTAGELGHVLVDESGPMCRCGNRGCLETFVGAGTLTDLLRPAHGELTLVEMVDLARNGDPACERVLGDAARVVGRTLAALCNQLNPERIVVGGALAEAGQVLLDPLRTAVRHYALRPAADEIDVVAGQLGERAELLGAIALVIAQSDRALSGRIRTAVGGDP